MNIVNPTESELKYQKLKEKIESFCLEFQSNPSVKKKIDKYFKGVQVMFSPLTINPKIMFIGINPGAGYFNYKKQLVKRYNPLQKIEYSYGEYRLAKQTQKLFELAELKKENLENSVKSNCFFFATRNQKELYQFLSHLKNENVYSKSEKWINEIVSIINPKIIICEGKSAFYHFIKNKECDKNFEDEEDEILYTKWKGVHIIGYKRAFSYILNIQKVADKLKLLHEGL